MKNSIDNRKNLEMRGGNYPNFLCVGAAKAGTTTFSDMIRNHPEVFAAEKKEINYFNQENYRHENKNSYFRHFKNSKNYKIRAEFSPSYLYSDKAAERILNLLGKETKILILLRNPVDRAFSNYLMMCRYGKEQSSFEDAFINETQIIGGHSNEGKIDHHFGEGLYTEQVQRYLERFSHVKIVLFEDFIRDNLHEMQNIYNFLGISSFTIPLEESNAMMSLKWPRLYAFMTRIVQRLVAWNIYGHNSLLRKLGTCVKNLITDSTAPKQKIDPAFAKVLQDYYHDDICELEKLIGRDLTDWKTKY